MYYFDKLFVAEKIKLARKKMGLTQSDFAEKIGISEKHLSKIETGKNYPSLDNFFKMAEILNISFNDFGINVNSSLSDKQNQLLKKILNSDDAKLDLYLKAIKFIDEIREIS